jgi:hypothetical protein
MEIHAHEFEPGRNDQVEILLVPFREIDIHADSGRHHGLRQLGRQGDVADRQNQNKRAVVSHRFPSLLDLAAAGRTFGTLVIPPPR